MRPGRKSRDRTPLEGYCIEPFREAIKSSVTKDAYERRLAHFLSELGFKVDEFVGRAKADPTWAQKCITDYMLRQKQRVLNKQLEASSISNFRKPLRLLLDMNDVTGINWKKISRLMPTGRRFALDRAPTLDELRLVISNSDIRSQAIMLTMLSSGIRIGAWDYLSWGDVDPIRRDGMIVAAKLTVYRGEPEEYITFITPEAYLKLEEYIKLREMHGEKITAGTPLARNRWQHTSKRGSYAGRIEQPKRLRASGVKRLFEDMLWKFGLRKEKKRRHEFSIHSVRKFFKTRAEQVMKPINVETLMGHSTGISGSYYRPTEKELLEDYLKAVPLLTISEVEEVRRESQLSRQQLEGRLSQLEDLVSRLTTQISQQALSQHQSRSEGTSSNNTPKKIVKADEIDKYVSEGWEPVMTLLDDGGRTWHYLPFGEWSDVEFDRSMPGILYVVSDGRVWKSTDYGGNFSEKSQGLPTGRNFVSPYYYLKNDPRDHTVIWLSGYWDFGLFKSNDGGESWNSIGNFASVARVEAYGDLVYVMQVR